MKTAETYTVLLLLQVLLRTADQIFIILKCHHTIGSVNFCPGGFADFLLLAVNVFRNSLCQKLDHLLFYMRLGKILHTLAKSFLNVDVQASFFFYFAQGGLKLIFALFHMTLWEGPMPAEAVFDEQQLGLVAMFAIDKRTAGFFMLQVSRSF